MRDRRERGPGKKGKEFRGAGAKRARPPKHKKNIYIFFASR